jgi:Icc-related predicted phosphoesterase
MHILFTSDLHGKMNLYEELLALVRAKRVESVLIGGDLLPTRVNAAKLVAGTVDFDGLFLKTPSF